VSVSRPACAQVQYHSDGRSAGHGVVIYETIEDAEKALVGTNGYRLEGRTIEVSRNHSTGLLQLARRSRCAAADGQSHLGHVQPCCRA
jgi:hypothetical protein